MIQSQDCVTGMFACYLVVVSLCYFKCIVDVMMNREKLANDGVERL